MRYSGVILVASILLVGCDSGHKTPPPDPVKSQREAMEKARQTEAVLDQAAADRLKQVEKETK